MSDSIMVNLDYLKKNREELLQCQKECRHFKTLYHCECRQNHYLKQELLKCNKEIKRLQIHLEKCKAFSQNESNARPLKFTRKRKRWSDIRNEGTKQLRLNHYKDLIFTTLNKIEMCSRADISMWVDSKQLRFNWSPQEINTNNSTPPSSNNLKNFQHDHICMHGQ